MANEPKQVIDEAKGEMFSLRGADSSRLENLTDAVFAIAITLLVVSLEVPGSFDQLLNSMKGFLAFGVTLGTLIAIWYVHFTFFRRYHLLDKHIIVLNSLLIFVVLFYIYPLKYLAILLINYGLMKSILGVNIDVPLTIKLDQTDDLMIIYGIGFLFIFLIFVLFHVHAYRKRDELKLTGLEILKTRMSIQSYSIFVLISFISIFIAAIGKEKMAGWSGWIYALIGPLNWIHGSWMGRKVNKLKSISV